MAAKRVDFRKYALYRMQLAAMRGRRRRAGNKRERAVEDKPATRKVDNP
jgi:hypothetical protein